MPEKAWLGEVLLQERDDCFDYNCPLCTSLKIDLKEKLHPGLKLKPEDIRQSFREGRLFSHDEGMRLLGQLKLLGVDYKRRARLFFSSSERSLWDVEQPVRFAMMSCWYALHDEDGVGQFMQQHLNGTYAGEVLARMIAHNVGVEAGRKRQEEWEANAEARKQAKREEKARKHAERKRESAARKQEWLGKGGG